MESEEFQQRLSRISTQWTVLLDAHREQGGNDRSGLSELVQRYLAAVYRYLLAVVRDADVADELCQEFSLKFLRGDFHRAEPERGRFRDYVKTVIINLVRSHFRSRGKQPVPLPDQIGAEGEMHLGEEQEAAFAQEWQQEVLEQTWQALSRERPSYYVLLKLRVECPDLSSRELAERYTAEQHQSMTSANVRKILQRAHAKFANLLVSEVASSLEEPDVNMLRSELQELDLLKYCKTAFEQWAEKQ